jgi:glucosamine--fructose-6-phosphate aminotransferase (isomerizing)
MASTIFENNFQLSKYASNYENAHVLLERNKQIHENSNIGIAHTRWVTHCCKTDANSHPHISSNSKFSLVHNGIIENYKDIKIS